ncbi:MAG: protein kinase, partial [Thermoprotei archaeon]
MESFKRILIKLLRRETRKRPPTRKGPGEVAEAVRTLIVPAEPIQIATRDPSWRIIESYYVYKPFVKVVIADTPEGPMYFVEEYGLTPEDKEVLEKLTDILIEEIKPPTRPEDIKDLRGYVFREAERIADKYREKLGLVGARRIKLLYYIERNLLGYGPIDPFMKDPNIEDISCNGVNIPIYVWHKKYESIPTNVTFIDEDYLNEFVMKLAHMAGKHISVAFPILDAMLPERHRLAATFGREVSVKGPTFTIRKFRERPFSVIE